MCLIDSIMCWQLVVTLYVYRAAGLSGYKSILFKNRVGADVSLLLTIGQLREHVAIQIRMHTCTKNPSLTPPGFFSNHRIHANTCPPASLIS